MHEYLKKKAVIEDVRKKLYARRLSVAPKHSKWKGPPLMPQEDAKPQRIFDNEGNELPQPVKKKKKAFISGTASHR